ncbi:MAG TPA: SDR family NAD(P)-dependent oxidoreductase [Acetobacteraceae bacterium]|nr:SDR family NAD(P)-dependent oxidoreductase [Acetobacteraceae bacterium]
MDMKGKVALVTGAGSGIGRATAVMLAGAGARVGVLTHSEDEARQAAEEIRGRGGEAVVLVADVADASQMQAAVEKLVSNCGRLDLVHANAGINGVWAPIDELAPEEWDRTINTNLRGTYLTLHFAVPHLKRAGAGAIVITASINGTRSFASAGATAYSATKAAQVAIMQMQALELGKHHIRVNAVCPGRIETEISDNTQPRHTEEAKWPAEYPQGKIPLTGDKPGKAADVAALVCFLLSDKARHISGTPVWIDGAQSLLA